MKPIIKTMPAQKVLFIRSHGDYFTAAPDAWKRMRNYVENNQISEDAITCIGISHDDPAVTAEEHLRFDACLSGVENPKADGEVGVQTIEGGKYAVFEHVGPYNTLGDTYRKIFGDWYPRSGVTLREVPSFVHYMNRSLIKNNYADMTEKEKSMLVSHVYVPIV